MFPFFFLNLFFERPFEFYGHQRQLVVFPAGEALLSPPHPFLGRPQQQMTQTTIQTTTIQAATTTKWRIYPPGSPMMGSAPGWRALVAAGAEWGHHQPTTGSSIKVTPELSGADPHCHAEEEIRWDGKWTTFFLLLLSSFFNLADFPPPPHHHHHHLPSPSASSLAMAGNAASLSMSQTKRREAKRLRRCFQPTFAKRLMSR